MVAENKSCNTCIHTFIHTYIHNYTYIYTYAHTHNYVNLISEMVPHLSHYKPTILFGYVLSWYYPSPTPYLIPILIRLKTRKIFLKHCEIDLTRHPCLRERYHCISQLSNKYVNMFEWMMILKTHAYTCMHECLYSVHIHTYISWRFAEVWFKIITFYESV